MSGLIKYKDGTIEYHEGQIMVEHPNGYYGCLYGKSSMAIFKGSKEVLHTGARNIHTGEELYQQLEKMPEFMELLGKQFAEIYNDKEDDDDI